MPNVEQLTNGARTTLAAQMDADHVTCTVTSALLFPASGQFRIRVDSEIILCTRTGVTTVFSLTRAQEGTTATSHSAGAAVTQVLTAGALGKLVSVYDDSSLITTTRALDFQGAGVTVTDNAGTAVVTIDSGSASGHTIQEDGTPLTARSALNFGSGLTATDDAGNDQTDVDVAFGSAVAIGTVSSAGSLATVARADHVHAHGSLTSLPNAHHSQAHELTGADHTIAGATTGYVLKATSATTAAFQTAAHASEHGAGAADALAGLLDANARVGVRKNSGATTYLRRRLNLIEGAGITITPSDDSTDEEVDVRIGFSGGIGAAVCASVSNSGAISLTNNTPAVLTFDTEAVDTDAFHDTGSNTGRLTVPAGRAGKYRASGVVSFAANATGVRRVEVLLNGTTTVSEVQVAAVTGVSTVLPITTPPLDLAEADYLELRAYQNSGGALNAEATTYSPSFGMELLATTSSGSGGHTVQDDGISATGRTYLNFREGLAVTDEAGADTTHVDLDWAEAGDLAAVGTLAAAGSLNEVPHADHVHAVTFGTVAGSVAQGNHTHTSTGVSDHGSLTGLEDDDHTQYLNETRHDLLDHTGLTGVGGVTDHGSLTGLTDDDHSQYLLASSATSRVYFGSAWGELTSGSATTLHTHAGAAHDPVTLAADAGSLFSLSTQELSLDTQAANKVWAGPTSGGDADPTFRTLVAADLAASGDATKVLRGDMAWEDLYSTINFVIDGGGSAITTGIKGDIVVDFACTVTAVTTLADQSGSIVVDIWKDSYANFPPTDADSITASAPPTLSSAASAQDTTLTGWTTAIAAGAVLRFNVDSCTTCTRVTVALKVRRD